MTDDSLETRLAAVERALTGGDSVADLSDAAELRRQLDTLATDLDELGERVDALEATVQSLHGYVGEIEHVNQRVERRADAARAAVERLDDQPRGRPAESSERPEPGEPSKSTEPTERPGSDTEARDSPGFDGLDSTAADAPHTPTEGDGGAESLLDRLRSSL